MYDPIANQVAVTIRSQGSLLPPSRGYHSSIAYGARLITFGGYQLFQNASTNILGDTWIFDLISNTWRQVTSRYTPLPRVFYSFNQIASTRFIILHGGTGLGQNIESFQDTWMFDLVSEQWTIPSSDNAFANGCLFPTAAQHTVYSPNMQSLLSVGGWSFPFNTSFVSFSPNYVTVASKYHALYPNVF
jgi:hypothetical protein